MADEDDVDAILDELAEAAPADDAALDAAAAALAGDVLMDAAASALADDALPAACIDALAERLADAATLDAINDVLIDAAADRIVEAAVVAAANETEAAEEALAEAATDRILESAIAAAARETEAADDTTSGDVVATLSDAVATTLVESAVTTAAADEALTEAFAAAVDARAAALAVDAIAASRESLAADAERAHEAEVAERAERESERAAGFSLLSSQLADLGSLMSSILGGRSDVDVPTEPLFPEPETAGPSAREPELDAPSPAGDLATRLADLGDAVSRVGGPAPAAAPEPEPATDLSKDLLEQKDALAGFRARLEHARLEGARLRALAETSPPATAEPFRDEDGSDGDAAPSHADLARLVDEAREALEGTRTAPTGLRAPRSAAPLFGASDEPAPPPTPVAGSASTLFAPAPLPPNEAREAGFDRLRAQLDSLGDSVADLADGRRPPPATAPAAVLVPAARRAEPPRTAPVAPIIEPEPAAVSPAPRPPPASYGFAVREPEFLAPRRVSAAGGAPAILSPTSGRLGGFRGRSEPEYVSPHSVAGDYFTGDYSYGTPESEVYLPTPAGPSTYRPPPAAEPRPAAPATWHAQPLTLPPPPTLPQPPTAPQYTVPPLPSGHVAIPGLDLINDTRPGMPRFGYAYGYQNVPEEPPQFIRGPDDL